MTTGSRFDGFCREGISAVPSPSVVIREGEVEDASTFDVEEGDLHLATYCLMIFRS